MAKEKISSRDAFEKYLEERRTRPRWKKIYIFIRYRLPHIIRYDLRYQPRRLKHFWQRGRRGWADCDAWSICDYIPNVMIGMLGRMTEGGVMGAPAFEDGDLKANEKKWEEILKAIADGFLAAKEINDFQYTKIGDEVWVRFYHGMNLYKKYFFSLWD